MDINSINNDEGNGESVNARKHDSSDGRTNVDDADVPTGWVLSVKDRGAGSGRRYSVQATNGVEYIMNSYANLDEGIKAIAKEARNHDSWASRLDRFLNP